MFRNEISISLLFCGLVAAFSRELTVTNTFSSLTASPDQLWISIATSSTGQYLAGTSSNKPFSISYSQDYGLNWNTSITPPLINDLYYWTGIAISDSGQYMAAVAANNDIMFSNNYGYNFSASSALPKGLWLSVAVSSDFQYIFVGALASDNAGGVWMSSDYGVTFNSTSLAAEYAWQSISTSATGQYVAAVEYGNVIYVSNTYGSTWTVIASAPAKTWESVTVSRNTGQYMAAVFNDATQGNLFLSTDYGVTWQVAGPSEQEAGSYWISVTSSASGEYITAATYDKPQGIWQSTDYGANWYQISAALVTWVALASNYDGNLIYCAGNNQTLYLDTASVPIVTNSPSQLPTAVPVSSPTAVPSYTVTHTPTALPTTSPSVDPNLIQFTASQVVNGLTLSQYNSQLDINMNTLASAIAECMDGVSSTDIYNILATNVTESNTVDSQSQRLLSSSQADIAVSYFVSVTLPDSSYNSLSSELSGDVQDGTFNKYLSSAATASGALYLVNATSNSVTTVDILATDDNNTGNDDNSSNTKLNQGAKIGIAVSILVLCCCVGGLCGWMYFKKKAAGGSTGDKPSLRSSLIELKV